MNHLDTFTRQRARRIQDRDDPDATVADWSDPLEKTIEGYFEQSTSTEQLDPVRSQAITIHTLVVPDPDADIRRGDRIKQADRIWTVQGYPHAPRNPFTGWAPNLLVRLMEGVG